jgi:hypothetical protein
MEIVYKIPGKNYGPEGYSYDWIKVNSEGELKEKLKDGWFNTLEDALKGERARNDEGQFVADDPGTPENEAYNKPATREEMKQKAKELGIEFPKNIGDKKLLKLIEAKLKD